MAIDREREESHSPFIILTISFFFCECGLSYIPIPRTNAETNMFSPFFSRAFLSVSETNMCVCTNAYIYIYRYRYRYNYTIKKREGGETEGEEEKKKCNTLVQRIRLQFTISIILLFMNSLYCAFTIYIFTPLKFFMIFFYCNYNNNNNRKKSHVSKYPQIIFEKKKRRIITIYLQIDL